MLAGIASESSKAWEEMPWRRRGRVRVRKFNGDYSMEISKITINN